MSSQALTRRERRQQQLEMRRQFRYFAELGSREQQQFRETVNAMPFWRRVFMAVRVTVGRC